MNGYDMILCEMTFYVCIVYYSAPYSTDGPQNEYVHSITLVFTEWILCAITMNFPFTRLKIFISVKSNSDLTN